MTIYYFDTSAIVKRYRAEKGTSTVDELFDHPLSQDIFFTSFLSVLELTSSIRRISKSGQLSNVVAAKILSQFRQDILDRFRIWPLNDEAIGGAVLMVNKFALRSADAIHMATAVDLFSAASAQVGAMVTSDQELLQAARLSDYQVIDPEDEHSGDLLRDLRARSNPADN